MKVEKAEPAESLSRTTARLSISAQEGEALAKRVHELLGPQGSFPRRDSAVSLSSVDDDTPHAGTETNGTMPTSALAKPTKRRRSSVQAAVLPKEKKKKAHKRKLRRENEPPAILTVTDPKGAFSIVGYRKFLLSTLTQDNALYSVLLVTGCPKIKKTVFAFVPGLLESDFNVTKGTDELSLALSDPDPRLSFFYDNFTKLYPTTMMGGSEGVYLPLKGLLHFPLTAAEKKERQKEQSGIKLILPDLLLTVEQMSKNNYPIHSQLDQSEEPEPIKEGWIETVEFEHEGSRTFALDCEFCQAASGKVLTRISIVNFDNDVVYDTFVKPDEEVTDYLTRYSGVTEEIVNAATVTLQDVQKKLLETVSSTDILVGHSLNSDLNVLQMKHPRIIDTSIIYDHARGPPAKPGLKWLAQVHLRRDIQQGESLGKGHSSVEDSIACMDLVKLKLIEGPYFGKVPPEMSLFQRMSKKDATKLSVIIDYAPEAFGCEPEEATSLTLQGATDDDEVVQFALERLEKDTFLLLRLQELVLNSGAKAVPKKYTGELLSELDEYRRPKNELSQEGRSKLLQDLNTRLQKIYASLPQDSLFIVCTEGGGDGEMTKLQSKKRQFQRLEREGKVDVATLPEEERWDFDKQAALLRAIEKARQGLSFVTLKTEPTTSVA